MAISYDSLELNISANVGEATKSIRSLKNSLNALQKTVQGLDFNSLTKVEKHLQNIAKIDFSNVSQGLKDVVSAFKSLDQAQAKAGKKVLKDKPYEPNFTMQESQLPSIFKPNFETIDFKELPLEGFKQFRETLEKDIDDENIIDVEAHVKTLAGTLNALGLNAEQINAVFKSISSNEKLFNEENIEKTKQALEEFGFSAGQINDIISRLKTNFDDISNKEREINNLTNAFSNLGLNAQQVDAIIKSIGKDKELFNTAQFDKVRDKLLELGFSGKEAERIMKRLKKETKNGGKEAEKGAKGFGKIAGAFKRILFYRIVRRAIQLVGQAIKEGIQNMALFDSEFNKSMSEVKSSISYLKNSFATLVAPLVEMVAPVLSMIADLVGDVANSFGEMFASMNGKNQFAKAKKNAEDYAESLKKAQSVSLGIDELNVVKQDDSKDNFDMVDIEQNENTQALKEFGSEFKDLLITIKDFISPIIKDVVGLVQEWLPKIMTWLSPILDIIGQILNALKPVIDIVINFVDKLFNSTNETVGSSITAFANALLNIVELIASIFEALEPVFDIINVIISLVVNVLNDGLMVLSDVISFIVDIIKPIVEILKPIINVLMAIVNVIVGVIGGALKTIFALINTIIEFVVAVGETLIAIFTLDFEKIGDIWAKVGEKMKGIWKGVGNFFIDILNGIIGCFEKFLNFFVKGVGKVIGLFGVDTSNWGVHFGRIEHFATGGFPEEDGFFYANHNELVGQFSNGRTAVANNEQITTGIYQAVLQAMNDSAQGSGKEIVLQIDGREIGRASEKYEAQKGDKKVFVGGYHYGY